MLPSALACSFQHETFPAYPIVPYRENFRRPSFIACHRLLVFFYLQKEVLDVVETGRSGIKPAQEPMENKGRELWELQGKRNSEHNFVLVDFQIAGNTIEIIVDRFCSSRTRVLHGHATTQHVFFASSSVSRTNRQTSLNFVRSYYFCMPDNRIAIFAIRWYFCANFFRIQFAGPLAFLYSSTRQITFIIKWKNALLDRFLLRWY